MVIFKISAANALGNIGDISCIPALKDLFGWIWPGHLANRVNKIIKSLEESASRKTDQLFLSFVMRHTRPQM
jgi:hypothetical protein